MFDQKWAGLGLVLLHMYSAQYFVEKVFFGIRQQYREILESFFICECLQLHSSIYRGSHFNIIPLSS